MTNVLIVCMGNICRSPMAQAVLAKRIAEAGLTKDIFVESAGTHASRVGEKADGRAEAALARRGYHLGRFRSRRVSAADFVRFDWILAMDLENLIALQELCPPEHFHRLQLYLNHSLDAPTASVPDPYYSNAQGFDHVLELCEAGAAGWINKLA